MSEIKKQSDPIRMPLPEFEGARATWRQEYATALEESEPRRNRSGVEIKPLYSTDDWSGDDYMDELGVPWPGTLHPRNLPDDAPRTGMEPAPVNRIFDTRGIQRTSKNDDRRGCQCS